MMLNQDIVVGRRVVSLGKLQYFVLPGKFGSLVNSPLFDKMFTFWKQQWEPLVRSLTNTRSLNGDEFLRQFEITALLYEDTVVGLLCLDLFDLDNCIHLNHSYFSWLSTKDHVVFKNFGMSLVINQLAVSKTWRGEYGIADLLVGLAVKRMQQSLFQRTICYTRNFRRTDSLAQRWGARPILANQLVHNEPSTYFEFPKNCFSNANHVLSDVVETIWSNAVKNERVILNGLILNYKITKGDLYDNETRL